MDPTETKEKLYQFIRQHILRFGFSPTEIEIVNHFANISRRCVRQIVRDMEKDERIHIVPNKKRNIKLIDNHVPLKKLPLLGKIAAGNPVIQLQDEQFLNLTQLLLGTNRFVLEVVGNSMNGDNICHGDFIICEYRSHAKDGEIVVAVIDGKEATLKRYFKNEDQTISLKPSNSTLPEHRYHPARVKIQGIYLGLIRLKS